MYTVTTTHELTPDELERAPKGLKRSSIQCNYSRKSDAVEEYEFQQYFLDRLGLTDRLELRQNETLLKSYN